MKIFRANMYILTRLFCNSKAEIKGWLMAYFGKSHLPSGTVTTKYYEVSND